VVVKNGPCGASFVVLGEPFEIEVALLDGPGLIECNKIAKIRKRLFVQSQNVVEFLNRIGSQVLFPVDDQFDKAFGFESRLIRKILIGKRLVCRLPFVVEILKKFPVIDISEYIEHIFFPTLCTIKIG
jgi:hypothetical protein